MSAISRRTKKPPPAPEQARLTVGISSRALFDLDESHKVFEEQGPAAYKAYQIEHEQELLEPGIGFHLVRKLLVIGERLGDKADIEVVLISRNSADTGLRIFRSLQHYSIDIQRTAFCGGRSAHRYLHPFGVDLFLSGNSADVADAIAEGVPAATVVSREPKNSPVREDKNNSPELRIAFDGDSVLFDDEAELIYQQQGLGAFQDSESSQAHKPMKGGPLLPFMARLQDLQRQIGAETGEGGQQSMLRTALVTARAVPAHERAIRTFRHWDIALDECLFLGSNDKEAFLTAFGADFFFDDKEEICDSTAASVATGHVPTVPVQKGEES